MSIISTLKIESENEVFLFSKSATQELYPILKSEIWRNLDSVSINQNESPAKFKCIIETRDPPDFSMLKNKKVFKIHSIIKFKKNNSGSPPEIPYVEGSFEKFEDYITFNPILDMYLINFKCKSDNDGNLIWKLEFEEK